MTDKDPCETGAKYGAIIGSIIGVIIGFGIAGLGGALAFGVGGFLVGGIVGFFLPAFFSLGIEMVKGIGVWAAIIIPIILLVWLIQSLWNVGKP